MVAPVGLRCSYYPHLNFDYVLSLKQASIDSHRDVDDHVASLLLRTVSPSNVDGVFDNDDDVKFDLPTSWSSVVDQTSSSSVVQWPVSDPAAAAAVGPPAPPEAVSSTAGPAPRRRRSRQPHTKAAVDRLKAWYDEHRSKPYADDAEVRRLAIDCQLGVRQVQKWLSNRRRMDGNTRRRNRPAHNAKLRPPADHAPASPAAAQ